MSKIDNIVGEYIEYRLSCGDSAHTMAKKIRIVTAFVSALPKFSKTQCRRYVSLHSGDESFILVEPIVREFMTFTFAEGVKTAAIPSIKALKKISDISDRNSDEVADFITWMEAQNDYSVHTITLYRRSLLNYFKYATELSNDSVRGYLAAIKEEGRSPKTLNCHISALTKYAEYKGKTLAVKRVKVPYTLQTENVPTEKEYAMLLDYLAVRSPRWHLIFYTLAHTGCRASEMLRIRMSDILAGNTVLIGKGNKLRRVYFNRENIRMAERLVESGHLSRDGYLCENRFGEILTTRGMASQLIDSGVKAGLRKEVCHPHAWRHFFAKSYLKRNKDVVQLAEFLGHRSVDTTRIYLQKTLQEQIRDYNKNVDW